MLLVKPQDTGVKILGSDSHWGSDPGFEQDNYGTVFLSLK